MSLNSTHTPCQRVGLDGVGFPMSMPRGGMIGIVVSDEVLQDIASPPPADEAGLIGRCEEHRDLFETIARRKFDDGQTAGPIRITTQDISD